MTEQFSSTGLTRRPARQYERTTVAGAVEYFREMELDPGFINQPCRYCKAARLTFCRLDVDERIELRIGSYRIAQCDECYAFQVVYARCAAQKKNKGLFNEKEFRNWSKDNFGI